MKKKKLGKNHGIWCGEVVADLTVSHEIRDRETKEVIETFYKTEIQVEIRNVEDVLINKSLLPVTVSQSNLNTLGKELEIGDIVFIKGSWRAYDYKNKETNRTKLDQTAFVKIIEIHDEYEIRTRNKIEFQGTLVKKLTDVERTESGEKVFDSRGKAVPKRDEDGNIVYAVRKNKEGKIVNDFTIAINRPNGSSRPDESGFAENVSSDYIPCISYGKLARKVADEIRVGAEVVGSGYIRARHYNDRNGNPRVAYEAVITTIEELLDENEVHSENE